MERGEFAISAINGKYSIEYRSPWNDTEYVCPSQYNERDGIQECKRLNEIKKSLAVDEMIRKNWDLKDTA